MPSEFRLSLAVALLRIHASTNYQGDILHFVRTFANAVTTYTDPPSTQTLIQTLFAQNTTPTGQNKEASEQCTRAINMIIDNGKKRASCDELKLPEEELEKGKSIIITWSHLARSTIVQILTNSIFERLLGVMPPSQSPDTIDVFLNEMGVTYDLCKLLSMIVTPQDRAIVSCLRGSLFLNSPLMLPVAYCLFRIRCKVDQVPSEKIDTKWDELLRAIELQRKAKFQELDSYEEELLFRT